MLKLTVGCDPEVFLFKLFDYYLPGGTHRRVYEQNLGKNSLDSASGLGYGTFYSAAGKLGGTKDAPKRISDKTMIQEDNVLVEFNTVPQEHEFGSNVLVATARNSLKEVEEYVQKIDPNYSLVISSSASFSDPELNSGQAQVFGCSVDQCAHMLGEKNPPIDASMVPGNQRFAGGHMHMGYDVSKSLVPDHAYVQLMEALVLTSYVVNDSEVVGIIRKDFYGKPGSYRSKVYGFEYRTPSNRWLKSGYGHHAADMCDFMLWAINNQGICRTLYDAIDFTQVQAVLNGNHPKPLEFVDFLRELKMKHVRIDRSREDMLDEPRAPQPRRVIMPRGVQALVGDGGVPAEAVQRAVNQLNAGVERVIVEEAQRQFDPLQQLPVPDEM